MLQVNVQEIQSNFSNLLSRVFGGEEIVILRDEKPVAKLVPVNGFKAKRRLGTAKGKIKMAEDFDEPLEDFKEYMP